MTSDLQSIQYAGQLIELARGEETSSGNPLTAAKCYATAMEIIISTAYNHAAKMDDLNTRRAFLCQIRNRVEVYYERAELLLQVAAETALLDKPSQGGGLQAALPDPMDAERAPALFGSKNGGGSGQGSGAAGGGSTAVMGIPLPPQHQQQPRLSGGNDGGGPSPGSSYFFKQDASDTNMAAPPPPPDLNLDDLMKQLGAPKHP